MTLTFFTTPSEAQAGKGSRQACMNRAAGDTCTKPACATSPPGKRFCTRETTTCRMCKDGDLYCKRPLPFGAC